MTQNSDKSPADPFSVERRLEARENIKPGMFLGDQYKMIGIAGKGKMGEVWEAYDMVADRTVAIKFVSFAVMLEKNTMRQVKRNFQAIHTLNHQYICPLYELSSDERFGYFLVMKWMPDTLYDLIAKKSKPDETLPLKMVRTIISNLGTGLDYAHQNGVIHRDIKPQNVTVKYDDNGEFQYACLIDFGLSAGMNRMEKSTFVLVPEKENDESNYTSGTPVYMPPEQWNGQEQDRRTDQYSLAVVAYELFAGYPPFANHNSDVLRASIINDSPEPIPHLPRFMNAALLKALSKKKEDRFANCTEFARALSNSQWQHHRRNRILKIAAAVFLLGALFFMIRNAGDSSQEVDSQQIKIQKAFEQDTYNLVLRSAVDDRSVGPEIRRGLYIEEKEYPDIYQAYEGNGWKYQYDKTSRTGMLTLSGYDGSIITANGMDLKIVVADDTVNQVTSNEQDDAIAVNKGNLLIEGGERGTGRLTVRVLRRKQSLTANAIGINTPGKNLEIARLAEFKIEAPQSIDGIMICTGFIKFREIKNLHISVINSGNTVSAVSELIIGGNKEDVYVFDGNLFLRGGIRFNPDSEAKETEPVPTVNLTINGKNIDYCVDTYNEILQAFDDVSDDTVILLCGHIALSTYRHPELGTLSSLIAKEGGNYTILSTAYWNITRGGAANPAEEILIVKGNVSLGIPGVAGETWVGIDGGAFWKRGKDVPKDVPNLPGAATFKTSAKKGHEFEIYKYKSEIEAQCCLVSVEGTLNLHDNAEIRFNDNVSGQKAMPNVQDEQRQYCGGVFVAPGGTFNMDGGAIRQCAAAFGGGVNVLGTFNMSGGHIRNNLAYNQGNLVTEGAGVRVRGGTFNMSGGIIAYNIAFCQNPQKSKTNGKKADQDAERNTAAGGGIHNSADSTTTITGGEISENIGQWGGGGIYAGGNGLGTLQISGDAKIIRNLATVGGGVFMNSAVKLTGGTIAENAVISNTGSVLINGAAPAGAGVYIQEYSEGIAEKAPILFLGGNAIIDPNNTVYLQSNVILPKENALNGVSEKVYIPIHLSSRLSCEGEAIKMDFGFLASEPGDNPTEQPPIKLVAFDYINTESTGNVVDLQADKFLFGKYDVNPGKRYRFAEHSEAPFPPDLDHPKLNYFLVLEEEK